MAQNGNGTIEELLGAGAGWARMLAAAGGDVAGALNPVSGNGHGPDDWLDAWSPEYIRTTLPTLRLISDVYLRAEVRGLDNIPARGPGAACRQPLRRHADRGHVRLLAGVLRPLRAACAASTSSPTTSCSRYRECAARSRATGPSRPRPRTWAARSSATPRCSSIRAATTRRTRPSWESADIDFAGRTGFVRFAIEHDVPIVPIVAIGGQETALFLGRGRALRTAAAAGPACCGSRCCRRRSAPPFGVTVLDLPGRIPLPAKITVRALPKIDLKRRLGAKPDIEEALRARHRQDAEWR